MKGTQGGGVALLMAFLLLVLLSAGALATSGNVVREWENTGMDLRGAQAFLAAESGLAQAALAAESGLAQAALAAGGPLAGASSPWSLPLTGEGPLDVTPQGGRTPFRVRAHCLGRISQPGDPECLEVLWEVTADGFGPPGPPGPAAQRYRQTCRAWWACPGPGAGVVPRRLAWQHLK